MTHHLIAGLRRAAVVLALLAPMMLPVPVHAQGSNEWANCREVTDPDVADRMQLCSAHAGCKLVLKVYRSCTAVRGFLDRLGTQVGEGVRTLFGTRREVQPEHIWEAVQTDNTRQLDALEPVRQITQQVRTGVAKAKPQLLTGTSGPGTEYAYFGEQSSGQASGWGTMIMSSGEILRGQFGNGTLSGPGDRVIVSGNGEAQRGTGSFVGGLQWDRGAQVNLAGTVSEGNYERGRLAAGVRRYKSGEREEGTFVPRGELAELTTGKKFASDGTLREEGTFQEGRLYLGDRYANGQLVERVDEQRQQRERIEAQQAADLERQRREREQRQAEAAAREQRFQQDLQRMNAGELYALADQLREQREADRARQVLRALITRFPNHPLAAAAAGDLVPNRPNPAPAQAVAPAAAAQAQSAGGGRVNSAALSQCFDPDKVIQRMRELCPLDPRFRDDCTRNPEVLIQLGGGREGFRRRAEEQAQRFADMPMDRLAEELKYARTSYETSVRNAQRTRLPPDDTYMRQVECAHSVRTAAGPAPASTEAGRPAVMAGAGPGGSGSQAAAGSGRRFGPPQGDACRGETLRHPQYEAALASLPQNSPSVLIRGALIGIDMQLEAYRQCPRTPQIERTIQALENQRTQALTTCRQIVSTDNCLVSPF